MEFSELVEMLKNPPEDGLPEDFADQLAASYQDTVDTYTTSSATLTKQLEDATEAARLADIAKRTAQEHNARLLKSLPGSQPKPDDGDDDPVDDPGETTIESLIEYK